MKESVWPHFAVMGAGAVGCYFGGMLAHAGATVTLIGRSSHVDAVRKQGLFIETRQAQWTISTGASTDVAAVGNADIVLFCVKSQDTEAAAKRMAPNLKPGAIVISMQNGVDNVSRIQKAAGIEAMPAVVYVAVAMAAPGHVRHSGRGDLIFPETQQGKELAQTFNTAKVPCTVSSNIEGELWTKLIINCAYNPISALTRAQYERIIAYPLTRELMVKVVEEAVSVAHADGIRLPSSRMVEDTLKVGEAMAEATSSTAQDLARGKKTEIDAFNGYVARRAAELGVPAPINKALHALIKLLEAS